VKKYAPPGTRFRRYKTIQSPAITQSSPYGAQRNTGGVAPIIPDSALLHPGYSLMGQPIGWAFESNTDVGTKHGIGGAIIPDFALLHPGYAG